MASGSSRGTTAHVGSVDVLKFLLAVVIVVRHAGETFGDEGSALRMGGAAVECFFVISGALMCSSAERDAARGGDIAPDTLRFLWRKLRPLIVPYLVIVVAYVVAWHQTTGAALLVDEGRKAYLLALFAYLPNLLLLSMAGIRQGSPLIYLTWYLSAMLLVMAVAYPLARRFGRSYTLLVAPLVAVLAMGLMCNLGGGTYKGIKTWLGFATQGLMRGVIGIHLGCVAWELSRKLASLDLTALARGLLAAAALFLCATAWFVMEYGEERHVWSLALLYPVLVGILLSRQMAGSALFDNPVSSWLGRMSMYVYLYHAGIRRLLVAFEAPVTYGEALAVMLLGSLAAAAVTDLALRAWHALAARHDWHPSRLLVRPGEQST